MANVTGDAVRQLSAAMGGEVALPGDAGYNEAVNIWNAATTCRPALVARCASSEDVAAALAFAQREGLEVAVRGGGHNFAGFALCDQGLMIDLTPMKSVRVDPVARRGTCGGGTTWGEFDAATQAHGLAVPGGFVTHTGVAGLTLGGGMGWLSRLAGLSSDNLVSAEVVTTDGRVLGASESEHADLFWALRGGGGNFGVVTEFEFALHPVGPMVHLGLFLFSPDQGPEMFRFARDYVRDLLDECMAFLAGLSAPPEPFVPPELHFTSVFGLIVVGLADEAAHARLIEPIKATLSPIVEFVTPIPYVGLQQMFDAAAPWGMHAYEKAIYLEELSDAAIDVIVTYQATKMSPLSIIPIFVLGGAYSRVDADRTAFGGSRDIRDVVNIAAITASPDGYPAERQWVRDYWSALVPHAPGTGGYVNFMSEHDEVRVRSTYGPKYERLQRIKAAYDPGNVFHLNANIPPAG
jgi:FAD/FMN-containing dehydrogenase